MTKFETYYRILSAIRTSSRGEVRRYIKRKLGDSPNNNRTLTVNQIVRYAKLLNTEDSANRLERVLKLLENDILKSRNKRTDAIDITELVNAYERQVIQNRKYRKQISAILRD